MHTYDLVPDSGLEEQRLNDLYKNLWRISRLYTYKLIAGEIIVCAISHRLRSWFVFRRTLWLKYARKLLTKHIQNGHRMGQILQAWLNYLHFHPCISNIPVVFAKCKVYITNCEYSFKTRYINYRNEILKVWCMGGQHGPVPIVTSVWA